MKIALAVTFALVSSITFCSYAQRPLSIEQVRPIIDSVQIEVDRLYSLTTSKEKAFALIKKNKVDSQKVDDYLCYLVGDTAKVLFVDKESNVLASYGFNKEKGALLYTDFKLNALSQEEQELLKAKKEAIRQAKNNKTIELKSTIEIGTEFIFHPYPNGYTLYAIAIPKVDGILPSGGEYLLLFDRTMKLKTLKKFSKSFRQYSIRKKDRRPNSFLMSVSVPITFDRNFGLLVPYFWRFRRYHNNIGLNDIEAAVNRRGYVYHVLSNEIEIKLFPIERK